MTFPVSPSATSRSTQADVIKARDAVAALLVSVSKLHQQLCGARIVDGVEGQVTPIPDETGLFGIVTLTSMDVQAMTATAQNLIAEISANC